eukprot:TRINITY_DN7510_c0_g1_i5.p1 TRINITY_DN7510_c0_g1~~TRINITY_DN7510_c0_g1_i5.p1  ORF type:complete len:450 (+),score=76.27 TRINITY_DN7510_c0_g1_i5:205-1554(+)
MLFYLCLNNGLVAIYHSGLFSNMRVATRETQGMVTGIVAAGYGLSAALWSFAYVNVFQKDLRQYFRGTGVVFAATAVVEVLTIPFLMNDSSRSYGRLHEPADMMCHKSSDASPSMVLDNKESLESKVRLALEADVMGKALEVSPASQTVHRTNGSGNKQLSEIPVAEPPESTATAPAAPQAVPKTPSAAHRWSWRHMLLSPDFVLLVVMFSALQAIGSGLFFANLALMAASFGIPEQQRLANIRWISYCNCAGRFIVGCAMDFCGRLGMPRIAHGCWTGAVFCCCVLALRFLPEAALADWLLPAVIVVGFAYGANWTIMPGYVANQFGTSYLGIGFNTNAAFMSVTVAVSAQFFGHLYDIEAAALRVERSNATTPLGEEATGSEGGLCEGARCWRGAYSVGLCMASLGLLTALTLTWRALRMDPSTRTFGRGSAPQGPEPVGFNMADSP